MSAIDNMLGWNKLSWPKKILIATPILAAVIGWQYYNKNQEAAETRARMLAMCEGEARCIAAVEQHAEACFKDNYRIGRRSQGVKMEQFIACVNERAGEELFVAVPKE